MSKSTSRHPAVVPQGPIELLGALIARASITPDDGGCQDLLIARLQPLGFECETLQFGQVTNLWARKGKERPLFCFAGHTDVVPPGDESTWRNPPFDAVQIDGKLYGRGAADMKGGLAAMIVATEQFLAGHAQHAGSIAFLVTSDEEGPALNGTRKVIECLEARAEKIDFAVVGEPSSSQRLGDVIRIGRRGSLSGRMTVHGVQGHVAYPELADNPIHRFAPSLAALQAEKWDDGNAHFPPTSFQMVDIRSGAGAANVTPQTLLAEFNFRYSTEWDSASLQQRVAEIFASHSLDYELEWTLYGEPFLTAAGELIDAVVAAISEETGETTELSTGGGTSDGRFIAPTGAQVVELGLINATVHQVNEFVATADVVTLSRIYARILENALLRTRA